MKMIPQPLYCLFFLPFLLAMLSCQGQSQVEMGKTEYSEQGNRLLGPTDLENPASDPRMSITAFVTRSLEDQSGNFWVGTHGSGIIRIQGEDKKQWYQKDGLAGNIVRDLAEDKNGVLWVATESGLSKIEKGQITNFSASDGLLSSDIWSLLVDEKNRLWLGTLAGVCIYDGDKFEAFQLPENPIDSSRKTKSKLLVRQLYQGSDESIWFATDGGAYRWNGDQLSRLSQEDGLCSNAINRILEDKNGLLWFASQNNGVCTFDGKQFNTFAIRGGNQGASSTDVFEDSEGKIWFTVKGIGIYQVHKDELKEVFNPQSCLSHTFRSISQDAQGNLWFGGWLGLYQSAQSN